MVKLIRFYTTFLGKAFSYLFVGLSQLMPFGNKKAYKNHRGDDMNFYFLAAATYDIFLAFVMIAAFFIDKLGIYPLAMSKNFFTGKQPQTGEQAQCNDQISQSCTHLFIFLFATFFNYLCFFLL